MVLCMINIDLFLFSESDYDGTDCPRLIIIDDENRDCTADRPKCYGQETSFRYYSICYEVDYCVRIT